MITAWANPHTQTFGYSQNVSFVTILSLIFTVYLLYAFQDAGAKTIIRFIRQGRWRNNYQQAVNISASWLLQRYPPVSLGKRFSFKNAFSFRLLQDLHFFFTILWLILIPLFWFFHNGSIGFGSFKLLNGVRNTNGSLPLLFASGLLVLLSFKRPRAEISVLLIALALFSVVKVAPAGTSILSLYVASIFIILARNQKLDEVKFLYGFFPFILALSIGVRSYFKESVWIPIAIDSFHCLDGYFYQHPDSLLFGFQNVFTDSILLVIIWLAPGAVVTGLVFFMITIKQRFRFGDFCNLLVGIVFFILVITLTKTWSFVDFDADSIIGPLLFPIILVTGASLPTFIAIAVTRYCVFRGANRIGYRTIGWAALDIGLAVFGIVFSAILGLIIVMLFNNIFSGVIDLERFFSGIGRNRRGESSWLIAVPLLSVAPSIIHAAAAIAISIPCVFRRKWREGIASALEATQNDRAKNWFPLLLFATIVSVYFFVIFEGIIWAISIIARVLP